jgi:hypothetical protein
VLTFAGEKASHQCASTVYSAASFYDARRLQPANRSREFIVAVENRARNDRELTTEIKQSIEMGEGQDSPDRSARST